MGKKIHITNATGRDASVNLLATRSEEGPVIGVPGEQIEFKRYLASTEKCRHEALIFRLGEDYAKALVEGDPEVDVEHVGRFIGETNVVFLGDGGEPLRIPPRFVEIILNPDGSEKERRSPLDVSANVDETLPVRWTGKKFPLVEAIRRFCFRRTMQISHIDGLTYDYLYAIAKELAEEKVLMLVGAGQKGTEPLIFQANGRPYRGFLEGRIDGDRYQLLLHLSDMELKTPVASSAKTSD